MADSDERSPLLASQPEPEPTAGPSSPAAHAFSEASPLLGREDGDETLNDSEAGSDTTLPKHSGRRWPSFIAITILALASVAIIVLAFIIPTAVEKYAKQGAVVEPTSLSLESITTDGVRVRIQANFRLDAARVDDDNVRRMGRAVTWIVGKLGTEKTTVSVFLPDYGNALLASADVPPLVISVVDGQTTAINFVADLSPGDAEGVRSIANQWLEGRLDWLRIRGNADIQLKSGILPLGTHTVSESITFEAKDLPEIPSYSIDRIHFEEVDVPGLSNKAMGAQVSLSVFNTFPVQLDVPPLGFEILVPNCAPQDAYILVADAVTAPIAVRPRSPVLVEANGTILELPESLTAHCPGSHSSPLDLLLKQYLSGDDATVFVRGKNQHLDDTPDWISDILASVTVPVPFPGRTFDNLIRNFTLADVHFTLPDPMAEPGEPGANPTVSGTILATTGLPDEMNFAINVTGVRANANVLYHNNKMGELNLRQWQAANSTMHKATKDEEATLTIQSRIDNAPLEVTNGDVLTEVIQKLLFGGSDVELDIDALVDIRVDTVLGQLELKDVPAAGKIPVKPIPAGSLDGQAPHVSSIQILDTTPSSITLRALVNITNPTNYTAHIPYISIHILCNDTIIGIARAENLNIKTGSNTNLVIGATWDPSLGGERGRQVGRDFLSEYISGFNSSIMVKTYRESIPSQPAIGDALSKLNFTVRAPRLHLPGTGGGHDGKDDSSDHSFIDSATFHVFSSTASFGLMSPLEKNTLYIETINATAYYNHTEPVGSINTDIVFPAPPGLSETPKLPVEWSPDSVGFEKLRKALGGVLKLDAKAIVGVRLGDWRETIWYVGHGIGARVRP